MPTLHRLTLGVVIVLLAGSADARPPQGNRPIELDVDASEAPRRLFHARLAIPAAPGPLTLVYPKWIPGEHGPTGPLADVVGIRMSSGGKTLAWERDEVDLHALHVNVPEGADSVDVRLDYVAPPPGTEGFVSAQATGKLAVFHWNQMLLYPKGKPMGELELRLRLTLPEGWACSCALAVEESSSRGRTFQTASLEMVVNSPVLCGAHLREVPLAPDHLLVLAADGPDALRISDALTEKFRRLVAEAGALFGARPYRSYRFFLALSDLTPPFFLEHHECSDNRAPERTILDESLQKRWLFILPHEYVHSWNGKYRRPRDMVKPDFQEPIATRLLWVYEGLTEYLGCVLSARCGIWSPEEFRENLALAAEGLANQKGRVWRTLEDTTRAAPLLYTARGDWASWRRGVDFYNEGLLLWLEVDAIIRQETQGRRSIDDFCRRFHGGSGGRAAVKPYTFDELVSELGAVAPHDWKALLTARLTSLSPEPPLGGIVRCGWKIGCAPSPSEVLRIREATDKVIDLSGSIGLLLKEDGTVGDVVPGRAADRAGVGPGMKLVAVNRRKWSADLLREAISATTGGRTLELLIENGQYFSTHALAYKDGERYPRLERVPDSEDLLAEILSPHAR